jgi:hypothetical protein
MTRDQIIETMARAMCERTFPGHDRKPAGASYSTPWERDGRVFVKDATAALSALEASGLAVVPGHAMASGHMEESAGKALYEHFAFYPTEQKPAWTPAGNAIRQDDARRLAMAAVNAWLAAAQGAQKP